MAEQTIDDTHGFFQFADFSDSDSDDGIFGKTRDRRTTFDAKKINYTPKVDFDSWYDREDEIGFDSWFNSHNGMDEIAYTAQRLYYGGNFSRAASLCSRFSKEYMEKKKGTSVRVANIREFLEIGAMSAIKINDHDLVVYFYELYQRCGGSYPGYSRFEAEVLAWLGNHEKALEKYIEYLVVRKQDARIWELIGQCLVQINDQILDHADKMVRLFILRLSVASFFRAHKIMFDCRNWKNTELSVARRNLQIEEVKSYAAKVLFLINELNGQVPDDDDVWACCSAVKTYLETHEKPDLCGLSESLRSSVEWIPSQILGSSADDQDADADDDIKNVEEL